LNSALMKDGYKVGHPFQYPDLTEMVYSNMTPRGSRIEGIDKVVFFVLQAFNKKYLIEDFNKNFFGMPREVAVGTYKDIIDGYLGEDAITVDHIGELHDVGYLPIEILALPEGSRVPMRVPMFTIHNTDKNFGWVTNMLETIISCSTWGGTTTATLAYRNRQLLDDFAEQTGAPDWFVPYQAHDFSMRGMNGLEAAQMSGAAHLLSGYGTDTLPAIPFLEKYYNASSREEIVGKSVNATEHSVMCMGGKETEEETYVRLLTKIYPSGIVSVVSDTWDFWYNIRVMLPKLKELIMSRDGKLVIRPDSGDPVKILVGDPNATDECVRKGLIECLWDTFGGTETGLGYKMLDEHIGAIYGDAITYERMETILQTLKDKGFASSNVVFGVGSYTYQYNTRDTFGFALKATAGIIDGQEVAIFKDPKTDDGLKKSAKGFLKVVKDEDGEFVLVDELPFESIYDDDNEMKVVFRNGELLIDQSLSEIRERLIG